MKAAQVLILLACYVILSVAIRKAEAGKDVIPSLWLRQRRDANRQLEQPTRLTSAEWLESWLGHLFKPSVRAGLAVPTGIVRDRRQPGVPSISSGSNKVSFRNNENERQANFSPPDMSLFPLEQPVAFQPVTKPSTQSNNLIRQPSSIPSPPVSSFSQTKKVVPVLREPFRAKQQQTQVQDSYLPVYQDDFYQEEEQPGLHQTVGAGESSLMDQVLRGKIQLTPVSPNSLRLDVYI